jgi:uncharacterized membrane protein YfcA
VTVLTFTPLVTLGALAAGLLGSLTGLGGGVVLVPLLVLGFGVNLHYAVGASLLAVIATSSGAAASYVREGYSNVRLGMFLEVATTLGALAGAWLALLLADTANGTKVLEVTFGVVLAASALLSHRPTEADEGGGAPDPLATRLRLDGALPTEAGPRPYHARNVPLGFLLMAVAGAISGLLGIGSGAMKVLALDRAMRVPFKVSTATSNFMIGVTAAASAGVYLRRGWVDPGLCLPVVLGVLAGAALGARLLPVLRVATLRRVFVVVLLALAAQMVYRGLSGAV